MSELDSTGAPAHEAFTEHFTDPIYDDPAGEFAPFGSDEGADLLAEWADRVDELGSTSTVRDVLRDAFEDPDDLDEFLDALTAASTAAADTPADPAEVGLRIPAPGGDVDVARIVLGAGFTLLRLTGQIDGEGRQMVFASLDVLQDFYGQEREFDVMRRDLQSFS